MGTDITPIIPIGRKVIQAFGDGGFKVSEERIKGSIIIFPERVTSWEITDPAKITIESLSEIIDAEETVDILVIGCGEDFTRPPESLRMALKEKGIALEWMDTRGAIKTFNVLMIEDRYTAAAIIAID